MSEAAPKEQSASENQEACECDNTGMHHIETQTSWNAQKSLLWQALPLVLLLLISALVQNVLSIVVFVGLIVTFDAVNDFVMKNAELARQLSFIKTGIVMLYLVGIICLAYPVVSMHWLFTIGQFQQWFSGDVSFWSTILLISVIDFLAKYLTMFLKCALLILNGKVISIRNRGRVFMILEGFSQIFRCVLPIPEWSKYVLNCEMCFSKVICWLLLALYLYLKFKAIKIKLPLILSSCKYRTVTGTELQPAESQDISELQDVRLCPICHENFVEPVKIPCGHIFCGGCISIWFDREQHCPKCGSDAINSLIMGFQTSVPPMAAYTSSNSKWKTGATDYVIQFF